jgi:CHAD domain-containing protein
MRKQNVKLPRKQKHYLLEIIKAIKSSSEALIQKEDGECLHDLRVAVRKLSSPNSLFETGSNSEGKVFASKEYCRHLFEGLKKRLAML